MKLQQIEKINQVVGNDEILVFCCKKKNCCKKFKKKGVHCKKCPKL